MTTPNDRRTTRAPPPVRQFPSPDRLDQHIPDGRRLARPGDHRAPRGIRHQLVQQRIPRPAAHDVDHVEPPPGQRLQASPAPAGSAPPGSPESCA